MQPGEKTDRVGCKGGRSRSEARVFLPWAEVMLLLTFFELLEEPIGTIMRLSPHPLDQGYLVPKQIRPCIMCLLLL